MNHVQKRNKVDLHAKNNSRPVWLFLALAGPDGRSHTPPNTGLVHPSTAAFVNWGESLPEDPIQPLRNFHLLQYFIFEYIFCVAFFHVSMEFQNNVIVIVLNFCLQGVPRTQWARLLGIYQTQVQEGEGAAKALQ